MQRSNATARRSSMRPISCLQQLQQRDCALRPAEAASDCITRRVRVVGGSGGWDSVATTTAHLTALPSPASVTWKARPLRQGHLERDQGLQATTPLPGLIQPARTHSLMSSSSPMTPPARLPNLVMRRHRTSCWRAEARDRNTCADSSFSWRALGPRRNFLLGAWTRTRW